MNFNLFLLISLTLVGQLYAMSEVQAEDVQQVYEYKNSQGVTEFTDAIKSDKEPVKELQIKKMTEEEKVQGKAKLEEIMEKDKALDARVEAQRQAENERVKTESKSTKQKQNKSDTDSNSDVYLRRVPYGVRPPHKPVRPRPRPTPRPAR